MNRDVHASDRFRITGLLLAVTGICIHQLLAPSFGAARPFVALGGVLVAASGLLAIASGVRRRLGQAESTASKPRSALLPSP